ncbi:F-box/kelch-repeat protein [Striga hermonthica]|uniref:F-box/kelch-repeat protein n=1 Tax=Striga hermonthica TaxID=68872 RepID=A0A9N7NPV5_STRHE|nr:F-box/kelch-repeat protein [Striga hermonthica]
MAPAHTEEQGAKIRGDVLETILSRVPAVDLVAACHVSTWWRDAVSSSLLHHSPLKPWLIVHAQATHSPHHTTVSAYDPRSGIWILISRPPAAHAPAALASSPSNFLYALSPSEFRFSLDPLGSDWCAADPPRVWRADPIVARVGEHLVVAGGSCDFEDDPLAVEIYGLRTRTWRASDPMPVNLKGSASSSWLSAAATAGKLVVVEKQSGVLHWFDPETGSWSDSVSLDPGQTVTNYNIGCFNGGLLLIGVCRFDGADRVKIWRFAGSDFSDFEEIGEMPEEFGRRLRDECFGNFSVEVRVSGSVVYVCAAEEVVVCEVVGGGGCRWWSVGNLVAREGIIGKRLVFSSSEVGIGDLRRAMVVNKWKFEVSPVN